MSRAALSLYEIENWEFNLGTTFQLVAKEFIAKGWSIKLFNQNPSKNWAHFNAVKDGHIILLASIKKDLYSILNSRIGYLYSVNKLKSCELARSLNLSVPSSISISSEKVLENLDVLLTKQVIVKPAQGEKGLGVSKPISKNDIKEIRKAIQVASAYSSKVIVQEYIQGDDYRLLYLDGRLFAATKRVPANVVGDGVHNVKELIKIKNTQFAAKNGSSEPIPLDKVSEQVNKATLQSIPTQGQTMRLLSQANLSTGGVAQDVTAMIHPDYKDLFNKLTSVLGLRICGLDIISNDITKKPSKKSYRLIEFNAAPGIMMHISPAVGKSYHPERKIVKMLEDTSRNTGRMV